MQFEKALNDYLVNQMCIDPQEIIEKIGELKQEEHQDHIYHMICNFFIALKEENAEEKIQKIFLSYEYLFDHKPTYAIIDTLRHVFDGFAHGGLHQIFTRQENEDWYPKVRLNRELKPNDIAILDETVTIYRGCSTCEYTSKKYGQSWTTSKTVADLFAYSHYQNQTWFKPKDRLVLQGTVPRSGIFYSNQNGEFEVVVNVSLLREVMVCA